MSRWIETGEGWASGRYEVRRIGPGVWDLLVAGTRRGRYRRASMAVAAAERREGLRRRRHGTWVRIAVAALLGLFVGVVAAVGPEANPAHGAAGDLAVRLDDAHAAVAAGQPIASAAGHGIAAAEVAIPYGDPVLMLTGEAAGTCYALYWNDRRGPVARALVSGMPCEPSAAAAQSSHNVYHRQTPPVAGHLPIAVDRSSFDWADVLPDPERMRPWALPASILLGGLALWFLVGASRAALGVRGPATG